MYNFADADPPVPTVAPIIKTQLAQIGVEATVEVLDRPICLKRVTSPNHDARDGDQIVNLSLSSLKGVVRHFLTPAPHVGENLAQTGVDCMRAPVCTPIQPRRPY